MKPLDHENFTYNNTHQYTKFHFNFKCFSLNSTLKKGTKMIKLIGTWAKVRYLLY